MSCELRYHACMAPQYDASFASALRQALQDVGMTQAQLARRLGIDPAQISRWCNAQAIPPSEDIHRIQVILKIDLSDFSAKSKPNYELFVSTPISGLDSNDIPQHHDDVAKVVDAANQHVSALIWPGEQIRTASDQRKAAPDIVTERNMRALHACPAYLYLQFAEVVRPSCAFVELGFALGKRLKITVVVKKGLAGLYMFNGFGTVTGSLNFLPNARIYEVASADEAATLIESNGRELLGLK